MFGCLVFLVSLAARTIRALFLSRADLLVENLALRQQVAALKRERPRPVLGQGVSKVRCHIAGGGKTCDPPLF